MERTGPAILKQSKTTIKRERAGRMRAAMEKDPYRITRELCNRSLFKFMSVMWTEVSSEDFVPNWHIEFLCKELEEVAYRVAAGEKKKYDLIINIPPGTTKTITCSIMFPVWCWTKWPKLRFIAASYSSDLSLESAEYARDMIRSETFKAIYPDLSIKEDKDTKGNYKIMSRETLKDTNYTRLIPGGNRYSTSVGGTLTGFHGHLLIVDDPLNPEQAASEKELVKANRWVSQTLSSRKVNKAVTTTILIMQRLHQDDPTGHWLSKKKQNVKHICLPGEIRNYPKTLQPESVRDKYVDDLLDPVRMPWHVMEDMEADFGQYGYAGQVGQDPSPPGGGMFQIDNFIAVTQLPRPNQILKKVRYWDKAASEEKDRSQSYTAGVLVYQLVDMRWIVMDVKRGMWATHQRERIIRAVAEVDGTDTRVFIEQEPGSGGKESAEATITNLAGFACYADRPTGDKELRADPYSVQVNNGNFRMMKGDWNFQFLDEHRLFPYSTHKDQVDAAAGAFNQLIKKRIARRIT